MDRKTLYYRGVIAHGGRLPDQATHRALGQACGYTAHRDLAGFHGGREPSMVLMADGSRQLTAAGYRRARALGC